MDHSSPGTRPEPPSPHQLAPSHLSEGNALNAVSDGHQTVAPEIMIPINLQKQQKKKISDSYPDVKNDLKKMSVRHWRKTVGDREAWQLILKEDKVLHGPVQPVEMKT